MDGDLLLIFSFVFAICLIVFPFAHITHRKTIQHEERKLELRAREAEAKAGKGNGGEDYRKLEERVRVLERIVTDKDVDLAREIEQLRDLDEIDQLTQPREATRS